MLKIDGFQHLQKVRKDLGKINKAMLREEANAVNVGARKARSLTQKATARRTGLSSRYIGRRIALKRANARKRRMAARVRAYSQKFSASYRDKAKGNALVAREMKRGGVKLGKVFFPGAWVGYSSRYRREFVGRRRGKMNMPIEYPSIELEPVINSTLNAAQRIAGRVVEAEMAKRIEKLKRKYW